jgi:hypothetical protein
MKKLRWLTTAALAGVACLLLAVAACRKAKPDTVVDEPVGPPLFKEITATSGVKHSYDNGEASANHMAILESLGGGAALIDYDGDGLLDLFLPGGGTYAGKDKKDILGRPCKLFKNLGNGKFQDVTAEVGLDKLADGKSWFYTHGAAVADYDRDGWPDLLVTGWGRVALFRNVPVDAKDPSKGRRFQDVTKEAGLLEGITWATSAAFGDLDGDGYPDLYICQYVDWSWKKHPTDCMYDGKTRDVCPPKSFFGLPHKVYHNQKGKFVDVSEKAGLHPGGGHTSKGLGVLMVDLDGDGKPDIYVANDTVPKLLYMNQSTPGKILLKEVGEGSGAALDDRGNNNGSMGLAAGDPFGTGKPALWVTNYENEQHALYRNDIQRGLTSFKFSTAAAGLTIMGQKNVGWGTAFIDLELDGREGLFVSNGHAIRYPTAGGVTRKQRPVLFANIGDGKFKEISKQIGSYHDSDHLGRGVAFGDLDNDGRVDMVLCHTNEPVSILRGIGGQGHHWLGIELLGKDHADVVGAKVSLQTGDRTLTRFAVGGGSYLSANDPRRIFGLGEKTTAGRLTVTWPDRTQQHFDGLTIDRYHRIVQGQPKPLPDDRNKKQ